MHRIGIRMRRNLCLTSSLSNALCSAIIVS
jgi:hypothetical protein